MINALRHIKNFYAAAVITGCCFPFGCENDAKKVEDWTKKVIMQEEATDIDSYLSQNGVMKARLKAPLMLRVYADTIYVEFPKTLHVDFLMTAPGWSQDLTAATASILKA